MKNLLRPIVSTCLTSTILLMVALQSIHAQEVSLKPDATAAAKQEEADDKEAQAAASVGAVEDVLSIKKTAKEKTVGTLRKMIILQRGEQQTLSDKKRIGRIDGFNPKVIEIVPRSPRAIQIKGKVAGTTELILELDDGTIQPVDVRVEAAVKKQSPVDESDATNIPAAKKALGYSLSDVAAQNSKGGDAETAAVNRAPLARKKTKPAVPALDFVDVGDLKSRKNTAANDFGAIIKRLFPDAKLEIVPIRDSAVFLRGSVATEEEVEQVTDIAEEFWPKVHNYVKPKETLRGAMNQPGRSTSLRRKTGAIYGIDLDTPDGTVIGLPGPPHIPNGRPASPAQPAAANPPQAGSTAGVGTFRVPTHVNQPNPYQSRPTKAYVPRRSGAPGPRAVNRPATPAPSPVPKVGIFVDVPATGHSYAVPILGQNPTLKPKSKSLQSDVRALHTDVKRLIDLLEKRENRKPKSSSNQKKTSQIPKEGKAVLFFTADWCGPCQKMQPMVQKLKREGYAIFPVAVDQDPELTREFEVTAIPELLQVNDGKPVPGSRHTGIIADNELRKLVRKLTNSHAAGDPFAPEQAKSSGYDLFLSDELKNPKTSSKPTSINTSEQADPAGDPFSSPKLTTESDPPFATLRGDKAKKENYDPFSSN